MALAGFFLPLTSHYKTPSALCSHKMRGSKINGPQRISVSEAGRSEWKSKSNDASRWPIGIMRDLSCSLRTKVKKRNGKEERLQCSQTESTDGRQEWHTRLTYDVCPGRIFSLPIRLLSCKFDCPGSTDCLWSLFTIPLLEERDKERQQCALN